MSPLPKGLKTGHGARLPSVFDAPTKVPASRPRPESHLEAGFLRLWHAMRPNYREPEREHHFALPRKWRFDFAWPASKVAVEIEGGMFAGQGHQRALAYTRNCEKYNAAVMLGWRVLRYTTLSLREQPLQVVEQVADLLEPEHDDQ